MNAINKCFQVALGVKRMGLETGGQVRVTWYRLCVGSRCGLWVLVMVLPLVMLSL